MRNEKMRAVGIVFVKCKQKEIESFSASLCQLTQQSTTSPVAPCRIVLSMAIAGPFDFALVVRAKKAESIQKFVFKTIRQNHCDQVTDTQTFLGWETCRKQLPRGGTDAKKTKAARSDS